jgi:nucleoid-associated protein YgaU
MAEFEELKTKYQSVLQTIQTQGGQLVNLHIQDGKLFMKGVAPSMEAANKVWDEIKRINPRLDDILADFPVDPKASAGRGQPQSQAQKPRPQIYKVRAGDTLSKISKQFYGVESDYMRISMRIRIN